MITRKDTIGIFIHAYLRTLCSEWTDMLSTKPFPQFFFISPLLFANNLLRSIHVPGSDTGCGSGTSLIPTMRWRQIHRERERERKREREQREYLFILSHLIKL